MRDTALIGCGYWGSKVARVLDKLGRLRVIVDPKAPEDIIKELPEVEVLSSFINHWKSPELKNVFIATPPETHYDLGFDFLGLGFNVFIEKPMATSALQAGELMSKAKKNNLKLMTGNIYLYNPGVSMIPVLPGGVDLYVRLLNVGGSPSESTRDLLYAGLPHACSLAAYIFRDLPHKIDYLKVDRTTIQVVLGFLGGKAHFDIRDYTGMRERSVYIDGHGWGCLFDVDHPNDLVDLPSMETNSLKSVKDDPLTLECRYFFDKWTGQDKVGEMVVHMIEKIKLVS